MRAAILGGLVVLCGAGGFLLLQTTSVTHEGVKVGKVPEAAARCTEQAPRAEGAFKLEDYAGKVVLLNFWAPWCKPCMQEMPALEAAWKRHCDDGLVIVGMALDVEDDAAAQRAASARGVTYPILMMDAASERRFGVPSFLPTTVIFDRQGHEVQRVSRAVHEAELEAILAPHLP
jgi:thiol-disulfide isomerase/thioredoxin